MYIAGDRLRGICPLRLISSDHVADRNTKKRFSDFKVLMRMIEDKVKEVGAWNEAATLENASRMYENGKSAIALDASSEKGNARRVGALAWRTVLNAIKNKSKKPRTGKRGRKDESDDEAEIMDDDDDNDELNSLPSKKRRDQN